MVGSLEAGDAEPEERVGCVDDLPTRRRHVARQDDGALGLPVLLLQPVELTRKEDVVHDDLDVLPEVLREIVDLAVLSLAHGLVAALEARL